MEDQNEAPKNKCLRCGLEWYSNIRSMREGRPPKECPGCHSYHWRSYKKSKVINDKIDRIDKRLAEFERKIL